MNKIFMGLLFGLALFIGACGGSSSDTTSDPCTEDPNLPECQDGTDDGSTPENIDEEV